ncbi:LysR family transcriptional regulator [Variovorax sp. UMC13]|uniref:LysR family transcriptional regulator n=1 Tax=Variovorax sp. UMC13 TaxID=1862326 RepID=UPI0015FF6A50|nr:LysR family transcriptional regulator [Variovorax sp. UMC13]
MSRTRPDPDKLRLIAAVARLGSLSKAALHERASQPYISKVIAQFEQEFGARLFQRTGRGMLLTEFGRGVVPRIDAWLSEGDAMMDQFSAMAGTPAGDVRLAMLPSLSSPLMGALVSTLREGHPGIRLHLAEGYADQLEAWLQNGEADLALTLRFDGVPHRHGLHLVDTDVYLCARAGDPVTAAPTVAFAALERLPLILHRKAGVLHRHLQQLAEAKGLTLDVQLEVSSLGIQRDLAAAGSGYLLLNHSAVAQDVASGRLQASRVVQPELVQHIDLHFSPRGPVSGATRVVAQLIQQLVRAP